ncbi:MAG: O-antigen ligase family protein [Clostridia bacterium]|nr:O-antigen ligase family protein [Clostridia bacterium]
MEKIKKRYESAKLLYLCLMAVYVAVREVSPLHIYIGSRYVSAGIFLCGFALIVAGLFLSDGCFSDRRSDALSLFLAVTALSCAVNFKYGYADNIKALGAMVLFFFLFFECGAKKTKERRKTEINCITGTLSAVWAFFTIASFLMFSLSIYYQVKDGGWVATSQGFSPVYNRLWGVFQDPNYAGYVSDVVIFAGIRFFLHTKKAVVKAINVLHILLQIGFLTLAGSFSATLLLLAAMFVFAFYAFGSRRVEKRSGAYVKSAVAAALCGALCYGLIVGGQYVLPYVRVLNGLLPESVPFAVTEIYNTVYSHSDLEIINVKTAYGKDGTGEEAGTEPIKRKDTAASKGEDDVSHGRFDRWVQTLQIFSGTPVVGTSPRDLSSYAKEHFPNTLMAKYRMAPHNGYLDILAGTGVLGAAAFLLFFLPALIALLKKYFRFENDTDFLFSVVAVFIMAASALFVSDLFFMISVGAFVFWTFMGYALHTEEATSEKKGLLRKLYEAVFRRKGRAA